jgi:SAM-dependent methyltransferase
MFPVQTHLKMLADRHRIAAYQKAIQSSIHPGDIIADIGTGTGILAFLALQAGAARVYALESGPIIETARRLAADNGVLDKIVFIHADSREVRLPEKVDAIVTETFGGMGFDEGTLDILADARKRFLKPGGRILPEGMNLWALPVHFKSGHPFAAVQNVIDGLDMGCLIELAGNNHYGLRTSDLENCRPVGKPGQLFTVDFSNCRPLKFPLKLVSQEISFGQGWYDGAVVYPELVFPGDQSLSLFDGEHFIPTHWELVFFPIQKSLQVAGSDNLVFHLTVTGNRGLVWKHAVTCDGQRKDFTCLSAFGYPSLKGTLTSETVTPLEHPPPSVAPDRHP